MFQVPEDELFSIVWKLALLALWLALLAFSIVWKRNMVSL